MKKHILQENYERYFGKQSLNEEELDESILAIAGGVALGLLGTIAIIKVGGGALKAAKHKIGDFADDMSWKLKMKQMAKAAKENQSIVSKALGRLKGDKKFQELLQVLLDNPAGGSDDLKTKKGTIRVSKKKDFTAQKKARTAGIKEFKKYLNTKLTDEEKEVFEDIFRASQGK